MGGELLGGGGFMVDLCCLLTMKILSFRPMKVLFRPIYFDFFVLSSPLSSLLHTLNSQVELPTSFPYHLDIQYQHNTDGFPWSELCVRLHYRFADIRNSDCCYLAAEGKGKVFCWELGTEFGFAVTGYFLCARVL